MDKAETGNASNALYFFIKTIFMITYTMVSYQIVCEQFKNMVLLELEQQQ